MEIYYVAVASVVVFLVQCSLYRLWRNSKYSGLRLPPGSSGLPLIGESLGLLIPGYSLDLHPFVRNRIRRYGQLFRTNVVGQDVIISADPEVNRFLFQQEGRLVERSYLDLFNQVFKPEDFNANDVHRYVRKATLSRFGLECIREKDLLCQFEELVRKTLDSWSLRDSVEVISTSVLEIFGEFGNKQLYGDIENSKELSQRLLNFSTAALSFPLNIPGTAYNRCIKDKDKALKMIKDMVKARRDSPHDYDLDNLLGRMVVKDMDRESFLSEEVITQMLFGISFGASETIATPLAFCLNFISDKPDILRELIAEHEEILKKRSKTNDNMDSFVTWQEYKSMTFTLQVVNETLRLTNTVPGILRKTIADINIKGFTIPAGWKVIICFGAMHLDPETYPDPLTFNPWRWKDLTPEFVCKKLNPFGGGINQCAGADFARATLCIFLHVLVSKYRWKIVKGGDLIQNPVMHFRNGLHISLYPK